MKKYCIVPINFKRDSNNNLIVRTILIKYTFRTKTKIKNLFTQLMYGKTRYTYHGNKIIALGSYFTNKDSSHKYIFTRTGYRTIDANESTYTKEQLNYIMKKRPYHTYPNHHDLLCRGLELKAINDEEAIAVWKSWTGETL